MRFVRLVVVVGAVTLAAGCGSSTSDSAENVSAPTTGEVSVAAQSTDPAATSAPPPALAMDCGATLSDDDALAEICGETAVPDSSLDSTMGLSLGLFGFPVVYGAPFTRADGTEVTVGSVCLDQYTCEGYFVGSAPDSAGNVIVTDVINVSAIDYYDWNTDNCFAANDPVVVFLRSYGDSGTFTYDPSLAVAVGPGGFSQVSLDTVVCSDTPNLSVPDGQIVVQSAEARIEPLGPGEGVVAASVVVSNNSDQPLNLGPYGLQLEIGCPEDGTYFNTGYPGTTDDDDEFVEPNYTGAGSPRSTILPLEIPSCPSGPAQLLLVFADSSLPADAVQNAVSVDGVSYPAVPLDVDLLALAASLG